MTKVATVYRLRNKPAKLPLFEGTQDMISAPSLLLTIAMIATTMLCTIMKAVSLNES